MRVLLLAAALLGALVAGTAGAAPSAFTYDRELAALARQTLWTAVRDEVRIPRSAIRGVGVRCYRTRKSFERSFELRFNTSARRVIAYYGGGRDVHLRNTTCDGVRAFARGRHTMLTSASFSILVHEALHRQGVRDERVTTCFANEAVRWGALWLGFPDEQALRARNLAFDYTRLYTPRSYFMGTPTCLAMARKRSWPDSVERGRR